MKLIKVIVPSIIAGAGLLSACFSAYGTPAYAKKEKQSCTHCHSKMVSDKAEMVKNLNAVGTCYRDNGHSLDKCSSGK